MHNSTSFKNAKIEAQISYNNLPNDIKDLNLNKKLLKQKFKRVIRS